MNKITESTLFPLSVVIILAGAMFWLTSLYNQVVAQGVQLQEVKAEQAKKADRIEEVIARLIVVEQLLKQIDHRQQRYP